MIKYLVFLGSAQVQLSRTGKKWISVSVAIRPVFPDPVTYITKFTDVKLVCTYNIVTNFLPVQLPNPPTRCCGAYISNLENI